MTYKNPTPHNTMNSSPNMTNMFRPIIVTLAALLTTGVQAHAATITASENTYVHRNNSDRDESQEIQVKAEGDGNSRRAYLRFDTSTITNTLTSATLDLHFNNSVSSGTMHVWGLVDVNDTTGSNATNEATWGTDLIWNNKPEGDNSSPNDVIPDPPAANTLANMTSSPLGELTLSDSLDGTDLSVTLEHLDLQSLLNDDTNNQITLLLSLSSGSDTSSQVEIASLANTGGNRVPQLSFTQVPEPSAFALIAGCFGLTWVMLRRR